MSVSDHMGDNLGEISVVSTRLKGTVAAPSHPWLLSRQ